MRKKTKTILFFLHKKNTFIITIFIISQFNLFSLASIETKKDFFSLANICLSEPSKKLCINAIVALEAFQNNEGSLENYSCQTRLLALQSYLIMITKDLKKIGHSSNILNEAKDFCMKNIGI